MVSSDKDYISNNSMSSKETEFDHNHQQFSQKTCLEIEKISPKHSRQSPYQSNPPKTENIKIVVIILMGLILILYAASLFNSQTQIIFSQSSFQARKKPFSKILWVQTDIELEALNTFDSLTAKYQIDVGRRNGYEVRIVDSLTAYDWLSPQTVELIRKVKHNSKLYIPVIDLLRVALLIEYGGVSVRVGHIFTEDLSWINGLIELRGETMHELQNKEVLEYCDSQKSPEIILFYHNRKNFRTYEEKVLIARPNSQLLKETFDEMVQLLLEGQWQYDQLQTVGRYDSYDRFTAMDNLLSEIITFKRNYWHQTDFCQTYSALSINKAGGKYVQKFGEWFKIEKDFVKDIDEFYQINGQTKMVEVDLNGLSNQILNVLNYQSFGSIHKDSIVRKLIESESNRWVLNPINKARNVQFCIISLKPLPLNNYAQPIKESIRRLSEQNFKKWKAVYFVNDLESQEKIIDEKVKVARSSKWQGLNLQRAATKHCGQKDIGIILDYDEWFQEANALTLMSQRFQDKYIVAAFVTTRVGQVTNSPHPNMNFYRTVMHTDKGNFKQLAQNLRAVSLYAYRLVPHFDLHDTAGRYFNRELPFYTLIQLGSKTGECEENIHLRYFIKQIEEKVEIPKYRVYFPNLTVRMPIARTINFDLSEYRSKYNVKTWCEGVGMYILYKKYSLEDYFIYNDGSEFVGFQNRKRLPQKIPRKIHQIWVGTKQLPRHKKQLIGDIKKKHPNYKHYLWTNDNITRQNFPATYDLIQLIFNLGKTSPISKMAMVADLMRIQIIYNHGGIYLDTNYYIFRENALDDWLTFKAMMPSQMIPNYKEQRQNGLFAAVKGFQNFKRILDHRRLSMQNIFTRQTSFTTGPFYFVQSIYGAEELDTDIFVAPQDHIYPFYDPRTDPCYCKAPYYAPDSQVIIKNKYAYWKNCSATYPWSFGFDFFQEGGSWKW